MKENKLAMCIKRGLRIGTILLFCVLCLGIVGTIERATAASQSGTSTTSQTGLQSISPSTCDYSLATDYFCTLPPGSTINLPMHADAIDPGVGWHCIPSATPTHIAFYGPPPPNSGLTIQWVQQSSGACGAVSGYAQVVVAPNAHLQGGLGADFFLANTVGICRDGTPFCSDGLGDNGQRWTLNISLPPYVVAYHQQVITKDFPQGTSPYAFPDYPPVSTSPQITASTVKCDTTTSVTPQHGQFSYSTYVSCSSDNGHIGAVSYQIQRTWPDRTDYYPGPTTLCNDQQTCQTSTQTFQTYGTNPGTYIISTFVVLDDPRNGVVMPNSSIQFAGANYQMIPYNNTNDPYPLINPTGWNGHHVPFPDTERLFSFTSCPVAYQGSSAHPLCSQSNIPLLRGNAITAYPTKGYQVPSGVTATSSGSYTTQHIDPIECGGNNQGSNGVFLTSSQATQFNTWWNNFWPCAPQPPTVVWQLPRQHFTAYQQNNLRLSAYASANETPTVTFLASWSGYTDPSNPQNHWLTVATETTPTSGNTYIYDWNMQLPSGQDVPLGPITLKAVACIEQTNCTGTPVISGFVDYNPPSQNWAGYVYNAPSSGDTLTVSWKVSAVNCTSADEDVAAWIGFGGAPISPNNNDIAQLGLSYICHGSFYTVSPFSQKYVPKSDGSGESVYPPFYYSNPVKLGDVITLTLRYDGSGKFTGQIIDQSENWTIGPIPFDINGMTPGSSEIIVEKPYAVGHTVTLAKFSPIVFTNATFTHNGGKPKPLAAAPGLVKETMPHTNVSNVNGSSFTVSYK